MADEFAQLIDALDSGRRSYLTAPIRIDDDDVLIGAGGIEEWRTYRFAFSEKRVRELDAAVLRNDVSVPQPSDGA